ncbi:NnrS family protein [Undibacterium arcticum]
MPTPHGRHLAALCALWIAGRVAMLMADPVVAAAIDLAFIPCAAWPLWGVLRQAGNRRNLLLIVFLALLSVVNGLFHAANLGWIAVSPTLAIQTAILIVVMVETVIGGRVIPVFTKKNTVSGSQPAMRPQLDRVALDRVALDRVALALVALTAIAWLCRFPGDVIAIVAVLAAGAQSLRLASWTPQRSWRHPLLWILHLSYAWIPLGLVLIALTALHIVPESSAFHALAIGAMAGLIIGMLTRTALGHTGRPLQAGRREVAMYVLIQIGAVARLCANITSLDIRASALLAATLCWTCAFLLYLLVYGPYLLHARIDGKEG